MNHFEQTPNNMRRKTKEHFIFVPLKPSSAHTLPCTNTYTNHLSLTRDGGRGGGVNGNWSSHPPSTRQHQQEKKTTTATAYNLTSVMGAGLSRSSLLLRGAFVSVSAGCCFFGASALTSLAPSSSRSSPSNVAATAEASPRLD